MQCKRKTKEAKNGMRGRYGVLDCRLVREKNILRTHGYYKQLPLKRERKLRGICLVAIHSYHLEEATNSGVSVMVFSACYEVRGMVFLCCLSKLQNYQYRVGEKPRVSCIKLATSRLYHVSSWCSKFCGEPRYFPIRWQFNELTGTVKRTFITFKEILILTLIFETWSVSSHLPRF